MMQNTTSCYYELELPPNSDLYKGEIDPLTSELRGLSLYFNRKAKLLVIGTFIRGYFEGTGVTYDFSDPLATVMYFG